MRPTASFRRRRGSLEAAPVGIEDAAAPAAAVANDGAVGQTRGGVGGRSRQLWCLLTFTLWQAQAPAAKIALAA